MSIVRWGDKITCSHSTATEFAAEVIDVVHVLEEVTKISLSKIDHIGGGRKRIKFFLITGGMKIVARGSGAVQDLYVYTKNPSETQQKVKEAFPNLLG